MGVDPGTVTLRAFGNGNVSPLSVAPPPFYDCSQRANLMVKTCDCAGLVHIGQDAKRRKVQKVKDEESFSFCPGSATALLQAGSANSGQGGLHPPNLHRGCWGHTASIKMRNIGNKNRGSVNRGFQTVVRDSRRSRG